jgi:hypothetical protein
MIVIAKLLSCPMEIGHPVPMDGKNGSPLETCGDDKPINIFAKSLLAMTPV